MLTTASSLPPKQPVLFIPHGGGSCFFMDDPHRTWIDMVTFMRGLAATLPGQPRAIPVVSGHWETTGFAFTRAEAPGLIYDYYNFPPHTYELRYDVPGSPALASRAAGSPERCRGRSAGRSRTGPRPWRVRADESRLSRCGDPNRRDVGRTIARRRAEHRRRSGTGAAARRGRAHHWLGHELPQDACLWRSTRDRTVRGVRCLTG